MNGHISKYGGLGLTENGRLWCMKALHPADPAVVLEGIPDQASCPTVMLNFQSSYTISPAAAATGTWSFDSTLLPHPVNFMAASKTDSVCATGRSYSFLNSQLTGATHVAKMSSFRGMAQRWRLAYGGVTVYQDGPDLSNQGTISVVQAPVTPYHLNVTSNTVAAAVEYQWACPHLEVFSKSDYPAFVSSQTGPNSYLNQSKFGAYVPLKLTPDHTVFRSEADLVNMGNMVEELVTPNFYPTQAHIQQPVAPGAGNGARASTWPHWSNGTDADPSVPAADGIHMFVTAPDTAGGNWGEATSPLCNGMVAHICARNLSVATSYTFMIRMGFEVQVLPGTELSPMQKISPAYDPVAIARYYTIVREFKDAYPADYNDAAKILGIIANALHWAGAGLNFIPEVGPIVGGISSALGTGADWLSGFLSRRKGGKISGSSAGVNAKKILNKVVAAAQDDNRARKAIAAASRGRTLSTMLEGRRPASNKQILDTIRKLQ